MSSQKSKILLICGCLEPGADGVGDYTRLLAKHASERGHAIRILSLNDQSTQSSTEGAVHLYRYQHALDDLEAQSAIQKMIADWAPDWISLQFVNFAYHPKGLIHKLIPLIQKWRTGRQLHLMLHELWVKAESNPKRILLSWIQKRQLKQALHKWQPEQIHSSNQLYKNILQGIGIEAKLLPIFSNISIHPSDELADQLPKLNRATHLICVFPFKQHAAWDVSLALQRLNSICLQLNRPAHLIQVGRNPDLERHWPWIVNFAKQAGWPCDLLKTRDDSYISTLLSHADLGIAPANLSIAGKSGAVQAMLEHGLPVFLSEPIPKDCSIDMSPEDDFLLPWELNDTAMTTFIKSRPHRAPHPMAPTITERWLTDLNQR